MTIEGSANPGGSVSVEQLIALNDEMAALVRAGVPLERGLIEAGRDIGGRLGGIARDLGTRLGEGERLPEALGRSGHAIPDLYRAVLEAGMRSGRLAAALEGMAGLARNYQEARRAIGLALLYPTLVLSLAYALFVGFCVQVAPRFVRGFEALRLPPIRSMELLGGMGERVQYWGPIVPALLALAMVRWIGSGRSTSLDAGPLGPWLDRLPVVGPMLRHFRDANFAEMLALLLEHRVPLDEGLILAADASGGGSFRRSSRALAEGVRRGEATPVDSTEAGGKVPPMLAWIVTAGRRQGDTSAALRQMARAYRRKAESRAEVLRSVLPTVFLLAIGAVSVLLYGLLLFVPMITLWDELALPATN